MHHIDKIKGKSNRTTSIDAGKAFGKSLMIKTLNELGMHIKKIRLSMINSQVASN
jgi:hypothetical protein